MRIVIIIAILIGYLTVFAGDFRLEIYNAYISGDMDQWKLVMDKMEREWNSNKDSELLFDLTEAYYGYIAWCISVKKRDMAREFLVKAEKNIELLLASNPSWPDVYSIKGALYGLRVGLEPLKAPVYGKKSVENNNRAIELGPSGPRGWMERANIEFYKPAIFGGSKNRAVPLYEKAVRLFEANRELMKKNWIYLNCLAGLANAYAETGAIRQADQVYRRILIIEPGFKWIKEDVYPNFKTRYPDV
ncbi:MAG TPA: hypothetical protein ENN61_00805 [Bacteroidaceae bacterium]|nr:hypothetical protein [Bacteroidaceae bacterium]